jgi:hypothetical protein
VARLVGVIMKTFEFEAKPGWWSRTICVEAETEAAARRRSLAARKAKLLRVFEETAEERKARVKAERKAYAAYREQIEAPERKAYLERARAEEARRASLTPEQRRAEDDAEKARFFSGCRAQFAEQLHSRDYQGPRDDEQAPW